MFVDEKILTVKAGKGGDGATLFRREKYVPYGGPDGGDGGRGGSVWIEAQHNLHALNHLAKVDRIEAQDGDPGYTQKSSGKYGEDTILPVPLGTQIEVKTDNGWEMLIEMTEDGQRLQICKGGNGGWGNWHFKSSINQTPDRHNDGLPGEKKELRLTLKLIADVGLVGLPNAGKSTFLSVISSARPKIANYPFTTLEPQLGVAEVTRGSEKSSIVVADLPGLIEGASEGKGLGVKFLRHLERTKVIIHCLDATVELDQLLEDYATIRKELEQWSPVLAAKPERIALTKIELLPQDEVNVKQKALSKATKKPVYPISSVARKGLAEVLTDIV